LRPLGCYVHLPFCDRICPYCDFAVVRYERHKAQRYLRALHAEIAAGAQSGRPLTSVYFGGGTPSALDAAQVTGVLGALRQRCALADGAEISLEANPSRNAGDLACWRRAGFNRVSIGVQSFDDTELRRLGRAHSAAQAALFVEAARSAGFENISIDLIAGAPGQSAESFERTLQAALACRPQHISVYGLTIEPGTPYALWQARDPGAFASDDALADLLTLAENTLSGQGFLHYELSNYARSGFECRHNAGYWRQQDCLAFGMSAAGYERGLRYRNPRDFVAYCAAVESGRFARAEIERLDDAARIGEAAMLALRTSHGIEYEDFRRRFSVDAATAFAQARKRCSAAGLLEVDELGMRLTAQGRLLANSVCAEFLTPAV
jgi:oxygen-independent coproporphyrinogen-3 oxidase